MVKVFGCRPATNKGGYAAIGAVIAQRDKVGVQVLRGPLLPAASNPPASSTQRTENWAAPEPTEAESAKVPP
jgi:hypothetical protein